MAKITSQELIAAYDLTQSQQKNWYQARPYCFRLRDRSNFATDFYLPISPSNLSITTHFATNVIATMYGTVEEHSEQRYFDIIIQGTTGFAPKHFNSGRPEAPTKPTKNKSSFLDDIKGIFNPTEDATIGETIGRRSFSIKNSFSTGGFFKRTQGLIRSAVDNVKDVVSIFTGPEPYVSAIDYDKTGYAAFHNFYRFLLAYKADILKDDGNLRRKGAANHPLRFVNYKDNNQYNVAIQTFTLVRNADDPMLYNYNIVMKGYKLTSSDSTSVDPDVNRLSDLGLDGVESSSIFVKIANGTRSARNAGLAAVAGAKGFGS